MSTENHENKERSGYEEVVLGAEQAIHLGLPGRVNATAAIKPSLVRHANFLSVGIMIEQKDKNLICI